MNIEFEADKNRANLAKHGVELSAAGKLEWDSALIWLDTREHYGEDRECRIGYIVLTLHFVAFVDRGRTRRIFSLRKAKRREVQRYA